MRAQPSGVPGGGGNAGGLRSRKDAARKFLQQIIVLTAFRGEAEPQLLSGGSRLLTLAV